MNKTVYHFSVVSIFLAVSLAMTYTIQNRKESPLESFKQMYPNATHVRWEAEADGFLVFFDEGETPQYCRMNTQGNWLEKGIAIDPPKKVKQAYLTTRVLRTYAVEVADGSKGYLIIIPYNGGYILEFLNDAATPIRDKFLPAPLWIEQPNDRIPNPMKLHKLKEVAI
ncbi:MAG: hypothetical protein ACPGJS_23765 [Flammeovirgaceae bacterium]